MEFDFDWVYPASRPISGKILVFGEAYVHDFDSEQEKMCYSRAFLDFKRPVINFDYQGKELLRFYGKINFSLRVRNEDIAEDDCFSVAEAKLVNSLLPFKRRDVFFIFSREFPFLDIEVFDGKVQEVAYTELFNSFVDFYKTMFIQKQTLIESHDRDFYKLLKRFKQSQKQKKKHSFPPEEENQVKKELVRILLS